MNLKQLKERVADAIEHAEECGVKPEEIPVTLQLNDMDGESVWGGNDLELHYDNNGMTSGCVLTTTKEED